MGTLAVVAAMREEIADYLKRGQFQRVGREGRVQFYRSSVGRDVVVAEGGAGREASQEATRLVVERFQPTCVVSAGFAAGARPGLDPGDLFLCDSVMSMDGPPALWKAGTADPPRALDADVLSRLAQAAEAAAVAHRRGGCMSVSTLIPNSGMKGWIGDNFPVSVIDLESRWVIQTADECHVPAAAVRSVLDPLGQDLPAFVGQEAVADGGPRWLRATRYVARHPGDTRALLQLQKQARCAGGALATFLLGIADAA